MTPCWQTWPPPCIGRTTRRPRCKRCGARTSMPPARPTTRHRPAATACDCWRPARPHVTGTWRSSPSSSCWTRLSPRTSPPRPWGPTSSPPCSPEDCWWMSPRPPSRPGPALSSKAPARTARPRPLRGPCRVPECSGPSSPSPATPYPWAFRAGSGPAMTHCCSSRTTGRSRVRTPWTASTSWAMAVRAVPSSTSRRVGTSSSPRISAPGAASRRSCWPATPTASSRPTSHPAPSTSHD